MVGDQTWRADMLRTYSLLRANWQVVKAAEAQADAAQLQGEGETAFRCDLWVMRGHGTGETAFFS